MLTILPALLVLGSLGQSLAIASRELEPPRPTSAPVAMRPELTINDSTIVALEFADRSELITKAQAEDQLRQLRAKSASATLTADEIRHYSALVNALGTLPMVLDLSCYSRDELLRLVVTKPMEQAVCRTR